MFRIRDTGIITNEKIERQKIVTNVILYKTKNLNTSIEKIAAAISPFGHKAINPIIQSKVLSIIHYLWDTLLDKNDKNLDDSTILAKIKDVVSKQPILFNSIITLPLSLPFFVSYVMNENENIKVSCDIKFASRANIIDFERKVFNNKIKFRYLSKEDFGTYLFQNILYSLNATTIHDLEGNNQWQAELARFLQKINFDSHLARLAFMNTDKIVFEEGGQSVEYYTGFVPYYNVYDLETAKTLDFTISNDEYLDYYNSLNVESQDIIPEHERGIFHVFPFKKGHYIMPNGKKIYLNFNSCKNKKHFNILFNNLCSIHDITSAMEDITMNIKYLDDVIYKAVNSETLQEQAIALLLLRKMVGPTIQIKDYEISLPNEYTILSWTTTKYCSKFEIFAPKPYKPTGISEHEYIHKYVRYVNLIEDIAKSCYNEIGAAIFCSRYTIPMYLSGTILDKITNSISDNEDQKQAKKYIFLTFMMQKYNLVAYSIARNTLHPKFGKLKIDLDKKYKRNFKPYVDISLHDRINAHSSSLITLSSKDLCSPYNCPDLYVFTNGKLAELVESGYTTITYQQLANLITLYISPIELN